MTLQTTDNLSVKIYLPLTWVTYCHGKKAYAMLGVLRVALDMKRTSAAFLEKELSLGGDAIPYHSHLSELLVASKHDAPMDIYDSFDDSPYSHASPFAST